MYNNNSPPVPSGTDLDALPMRIGNLPKEQEDRAHTITQEYYQGDGDNKGTNNLKKIYRRKCLLMTSNSNASNINNIDQKTCNQGKTKQTWKCQKSHSSSQRSKRKESFHILCNNYMRKAVVWDIIIRIIEQRMQNG